ncbi:hypothetical protein RJT34_16450 [Clitoria ternatea]|uniref:Uncharacterized protein n=1 Tax=Clitoria ternatea TaxID=43366 RepID=A0AAN9PDP5_CLITE
MITLLSAPFRFRAHLVNFEHSRIHLRNSTYKSHVVLLRPSPKTTKPRNRATEDSINRRSLLSSAPSRKFVVALLSPFF